MFTSLTQWFRKGQPRYRVAVCAIVKNEAPYLREWVALHRLLGVEHFFIADNDSDDGTTDLLAAMQAAGLLTTFRFETPAHRPAQLEAYGELMRRFGSEAEWFAFIDADEFLMPRDPAFRLAQFLETLPPNVGAVAVNWAIYGSSGRVYPGEGMILDRFTRRAKDDSKTNHHYKSIVRASSYRAVAINPHFFQLQWGARTVHVDGEPMVDHPERGAGLSQDIRWEPLRLNHYVIKSLAEFQRKKAPRGRAMSAVAKRPLQFFRAHDRNEVAEPVAGAILEAVRVEMERIGAQLRKAGCDPAVLDLHRSIADLAPLEAPGDVVAPDKPAARQIAPGIEPHKLVTDKDSTEGA